MSVFKSIKGTLQSVQHDISSSFKSIKTSHRYSHLTGAQQGVNVEAGAELLSRFQSNWEELHVKNEENARCAEVLYQDFSMHYALSDRQTSVYSRLEEQVQGLPAFIEALQGLTDTIAQLEELFDHVEASMVQLEDICQEEEFEKARQSHAKQFTAYKQIRQDDLEKVKVKLAQEHANKMQTYDAERQAAMRDRQEAFEDAFVQDVNFYKIYGRTERLPSSDSGKVPDLADITLDEDKEALDDFLDSADATTLTEKVTVVSDESSDIDAVFENEDDNTTTLPGPSSGEQEQLEPISGDVDEQRLPVLPSGNERMNEESPVEDQETKSDDPSEKDDSSKPEIENTENSEDQDGKSSARNAMETSEQNDTTAATESPVNNSEVEESNDGKTREQKISTDEDNS